VESAHCGVVQRLASTLAIGSVQRCTSLDQSTHRRSPSTLHGEEQWRLPPIVRRVCGRTALEKQGQALIGALCRVAASHDGCVLLTSGIAAGHLPWYVHSNWGGIPRQRCSLQRAGVVVRTNCAQ